MKCAAHWFSSIKRPLAPKIRAQAAILIIATAAIAAIAMALPLCIKAQGAGFGSLLWVLLLTLAALTVALQLTWAPLCLKPLAWLVSRIHQFLNIPIPLTQSNSRG